MDIEDRELLELAAKAAGYRIELVPDHFDCVRVHAWVNDACCVDWNPLTDDGDALRLACTLGLTVECDFHDSDTCTASQTRGEIVADEQSGMVGEVIGDPEFKATRRAIVLAAAQIGMTTP